MCKKMTRTRRCSVMRWKVQYVSRNADAVLRASFLFAQ
nr:MAG TPA: hypothetical protein [Caudoviricetes sp.]